MQIDCHFFDRVVIVISKFSTNRVTYLQRNTGLRGEVVEFCRIKYHGKFLILFFNVLSFLASLVTVKYV